MHRFTGKMKREFRALIRPMLEAGKHQYEIEAELKRIGFTMPDGKPIHKSTIARHACQMGLRRRRTRKDAKPIMPERQQAKAETGRLGVIADILTVPGLSDQTRLEVIAALTGGKV